MNKEYLWLVPIWAGLIGSFVYALIRDAAIIGWTPIIVPLVVAGGLILYNYLYFRNKDKKGDKDE